MRLLAYLVLGLSAVLAACGGPVTPLPATAATAAEMGSLSPLSSGVVRTSSGLYQGVLETGVVSFKGIPYAQPPLGDLRWKAPRPVADSSERFDATQYGPACPQSALGGDVLKISAPARQSEDCLKLNVWTPAHDAAAKLPVMVWVHGGWFSRGSARQYPGYELAKKGNVVVVTLDYRLGPLGFLAHPALETESPRQGTGNYGLLDQIEALRWVRKNIGAFGGDPDRVTLFGQSAGGISVCYLLASPLAKGLFQRAIMQSGTCSEQGPASLAYKERQGIALTNNVHCGTDADVLACLRRKSAADILAALPTSASYGGAVYYGPTRDGYLLPDAGRTLLEAQTDNHVPVMIGSTADDASRFVPHIDTRQALDAYVHERWPQHAQDLAALYPAASDQDVHAVVVRAFTDSRYGCPALRVADLLASHGHPTYLYLFTHVPAFGTREGIGAYHGAELSYVFGDLRRTGAHEYGSDDRALSDRLVAIWTRFAATGKPDGPGLPDWPAFTPGSATVQELAVDQKSIDSPEAHACTVLQRLGY